MNKSKVLYKLYAQPLINRKGKSPSAVCKEYYSDLNDFKERKYQEEAQIWLLLSYLHDESLEMPNLFKSIIAKNPALDKYIRYYLWLCKIYDFTRKDTDAEYSLFEYFRSGQNEKFLEKIQAQPKSEGWEPLTFSGAVLAPSASHFKLWCETAFDICKRKDIKRKDFELYLSLAGDKRANKKHESNIFDRMWSQIYSIICLASSEKQFYIRFDGLNPDEQSNFEVIALSILNNISTDIESIYSNEDYPLIFRVHVAACFNKLPIGLLQTYISELISKRLIGLIIFYSSLTDKENSVSLLADILAAFEPSEDLIDIIKQSGIDEAELICKIVERLSNTTIEDFGCEITRGEITEMKIKCLEWLALVPSLKSRTLLNVRKIISSLVIHDEYEGALEVFQKFSKHFTNKAEMECWAILIAAELDYRKWSQSDKKNYPEASFRTMKNRLQKVLSYRGGWMVDCPDVDIEVGSHCIPLVVDHLFDAYMSNDELEEARGISIHIWINYPQIKKYFNNDNLMHFILLAKEAWKESYSKSSRT